jgi:rubredoxin
MKCSFCEQPLACKSCGKAFAPRKGETHLGAYQPDTHVNCPECQKVLICKACGYVYGEEERDEE